MKIKVAIIEPVGGHGGMDYYDYGLCGGLVSSNVDVVLHTCDERCKPESSLFEVRYTYAGIFGNRTLWLRGLRFVLGSVRAILSTVWEGRKIVHFHFFHVGPLSLFNIILARLFCRKVVITAHDVESFVASLEVSFLSQVAYSFAHQVIAHNTVSRDELIRCLKVSRDRIAVVPHGNYLHARRSMPSIDVARKELGVPLDAKVLLFFGQIKDVKGLDLLLSAMPIVLKKHENAILLIAGKPWKTDFAVYQRQIEQLCIEKSCITDIRYVPDIDVPYYYAAADLVVLPYRRIYQSGVVLMAMSYGKAVLVSNIVGMLEVVHDRVTGFVFDLESEGDLARKICEVLDDYCYMDKVSRQGYDLMRENYDWSMVGKMTESVYSRLI